LIARRDTARAMAALGLALSFTPTLMRRSRRDQALISVASAVLGAAAGAASEVLVVRLAERVEGGEPVARWALVGAGVLSTAAELPASPSSAVALAGTGARVAGIGALVGGLTPVREAPRVRDWGSIAVLAGVGAAGFVVWRRRRAARKPRLRHYPAERYEPTVSGGEGSLVPRETLDFEGTRFLALATPGAIRVFVGVKSAPTVEARCDLAVAELERLGAFERRRILVCSATLRGYVNPVPVEAEEVLSGADTASVVVQYFDRRTILMPAKVPIAARTHRALLERLAARVGEGGPEIAVYGESLGAWASQNVFRRDAPAALDALKVARALWIGTPYFSRLGRNLPDDPRFAIVRTKELIDPERPPAPWLRFVLLQRLTDPVVLFPGLELIWRRPAWLREGAWRPGITFVQVLADLMAATRWTSAVPQALAHDYRLEGPLAVDLAFGHGAPREELSRLADTLIARERERGARLRALRSAKASVET
jgi:uncharacterized membrane protein